VVAARRRSLREGSGGCLVLCLVEKLAVTGRVEKTASGCCQIPTVARVQVAGLRCPWRHGSDGRGWLAANTSLH
jgi:hypothetical protein